MDFKQTPPPTSPGVRGLQSKVTERWPSVTLLTGGLAGKMHRLEGPRILLGRGTDCGVRLTDHAVSRHHARLDMSDDGTVTLVDLNSTNGTYINGEAIHEQVLVPGDKIGLGQRTLLRFNLLDALDTEFLNRQFRAATRDALTGCYVRSFFDHELHREAEFARRSHIPLSVALFDLDGFKAINDTFGHAGGDVALQAIAHALQHSLRTYDTLCRNGGDEFSLLMRATEPVIAGLIAERLRTVVQRLQIPIAGTTCRLTVSVGVASSAEFAAVRAERLVRLADERMYKAKHCGGNLVVAAGRMLNAGTEATRRFDKKSRS